MTSLGCVPSLEPPGKYVEPTNSSFLLPFLSFNLFLTVVRFLNPISGTRTRLVPSPARRFLEPCLGVVWTTPVLCCKFMIADEIWIYEYTHVRQSSRNNLFKMRQRTCWRPTKWSTMFFMDHLHRLLLYLESSSTKKKLWLCDNNQVELTWTKFYLPSDKIWPGLVQLIRAR